MRAWNEVVAALDAVVPVPMLAFLSLIATTMVSLAWYFWPRWLPWHWTWRDGSRRERAGRRRSGDSRRRLRLGAMRWRWRLRWRRRKRDETATDERPADELPDLPASVLAMTADQLAAQGRYAEAVRERLRAIVRDLVEREVIPFRPGWTVTELAAAATRARPTLAGPLSTAVHIFAEIWYGLRLATADDDMQMRAQATATHQRLLTPAATAAPASAASAASAAGTSRTDVGT